MKHFDWLSTIQGIYCDFVTDLSLTRSSFFSLKAFVASAFTILKFRRAERQLHLPFD